MRMLTGYVATLDVLGFSELLYRDQYSAKLREYIDCINGVIRPADTDTECVVFSDSIVLTAPGEDDDALKRIVTSCAGAFHALLMKDIPVRGAIAFGRYWRHAANGSLFLAGRPIVEAYRLERSLKWVGTMLCPSALRRCEDLEKLTAIPDAGDIFIQCLEEPDQFQEKTSQLALCLQPATAPYQALSEQGYLDGYAVVPVTADATQLGSARRDVRRALRALKHLQMQAGQPEAQAKHRSTITWLESVEKSFLKGIADIKAGRKDAENEKVNS